MRNEQQQEKEEGTRMSRTGVTKVNLKKKRDSKKKGGGNLTGKVDGELFISFCFLFYLNKSDFRNI